MQSNDGEDYDISTNIDIPLPITIDQALRQSGITAWQGTAHFTGNNIKIGVIYPGFFGFDTSDNSIEQNLSSNLPDPRGTQALHLIQSIAPNANYLVCDYRDGQSFGACIDWLIGHSVNIIYHGTGILEPSTFAEDLLRHTERAINEKIFWVNAAGDLASSSLNSIYRQSESSAFHVFNATGTTSLKFEAVDIPRRIALSWSGENVSTLYLNIIDAETSERIESEQADIARNLSYTTAFIAAGKSFNLQIGTYGENGPGNGIPFLLTVEYAAFPTASSREKIIAPASSLNALTVGALRTNVIAPYSSQGPLPSSGIKPDLVAPGEIQLPDGDFIGTAASAAVVTGAAALILEANPTWDNSELKSYLMEDATQDDSQIAGVDVTYGQGRLYLPLPPTNNPTATPAAAPIDQTSPPISVPPVDLEDVRIVFTRQNDLYLRETDGNITSLVTAGASYEPDIGGTTAVFSASRNNEQLNIFAVDIISGRETQLTTNPLQDRHPNLSPDGSQVAFSSNRDGNWEIYLVNIDGSNERRLTQTDYFEYAPAWSPDGQFLTYQSEQYGLPQIAIHNLSNNTVEVLTRNEVALVGALWSPDGSKIACFANVNTPYIVMVDVQTHDITEMNMGTVDDWIDAQTILFHRSEADTLNIYMLDIVSGEETLVIQNGSWAATS